MTRAGHGVPDLTHERVAGHPDRAVAGVDEVGRGPLAGPLVAAAVVIPPEGLPAALAGQVDDSKRVPKGQRPLVANALRATVPHGLGQASVGEIDALGLSAALALAMARAVAALPRPPDHVLVDGRWSPPGLPCPVSAVVGGDRLCLSIAAASILAKVARDAIMVDLDRHHPGYGWATNMGYPTAEHRAALGARGITPHHRRSFGPVAAVLSAGA